MFRSEAADTRTGSGFRTLNLKTERVAIAYRLLFAYPFVRPESEQNSSHLQIVVIGVVITRPGTVEVSAQADIDAVFPLLRSACRLWIIHVFRCVVGTSARLGIFLQNDFAHPSAQD